MTREQQKAIIRNWTSTYYEMRGGLDFWFAHMTYGVTGTYTKNCGTKEEVQHNAYNLVYRSVRACVEKIEIGR